MGRPKSDTPYGCPFTRESSSTFYPHFGRCTGTKRSNWHWQTACSFAHKPTRTPRSVPPYLLCHYYRTHRTVVPSPENHRRRRPPQKRYFTLILGKTRVQNNQTGTHKLHAVLHQQRELPCPTLLLLPCYLCYSATSLHYYIMPTLLSPIIETVCPFECAALASLLLPHS
jgi:hypothetical protein